MNHETRITAFSRVLRPSGGEKCRLGSESRLLSFEDLFSRWDWRPIPGCPGRYLLSPGVFSGEPRRLLNEACAVRELQSPKAPDPVSVATIDGGGLISYRKPDGRFIHTLNTPEGLKRKLHQLEIEQELT